VLRTPPRLPGLTAWLPRAFRQVARRAGATAGHVTLVLVADTDMAQLHWQYQRVRGTTDVLTFDLRHPPADPATPLDADLVLCVDTARRQATARGHAVRLELLLYATHGLLHLLGYDDHNPAAAAAMHQREDDLLTAAGFGSVYAQKRAAVRGQRSGRRTTG